MRSSARPGPSTRAATGWPVAAACALSTCQASTLPVGLETVPYTRLRDDEAWGVGLDLDLLAKVGDVDPQVLLRLPVALAPDSVKQLFMREGAAWVRSEREQQRPFGRGQVHGGITAGDRPSVNVDDQIADDERLVLGGRHRHACTAKLCAHTGAQFDGAERLGHVVVGAGIEQCHLVELGLPR